MSGRKTDSFTCHGSTEGTINAFDHYCKSSTLVRCGIGRISCPHVICVWLQGKIWADGNERSLCWHPVNTQEARTMSFIYIDFA